MQMINDKSMLMISRITILVVPAIAFVIVLETFQRRWCYFGYDCRWLDSSLVDYIPFGVSTIATIIGVYSLISGFIICIVVMIIVSLLTQATSKAMSDIFDEVTTNKEMTE